MSTLRMLTCRVVIADGRLLLLKTSFGQQACRNLGPVLLSFGGSLKASLHGHGTVHAVLMPSNILGKSKDPEQ